MGFPDLPDDILYEIFGNLEGGRKYWWDPSFCLIDEGWVLSLRLVCSKHLPSNYTYTRELGC
jgi:hypothetical protein